MGIEVKATRFLESLLDPGPPTPERIVGCEQPNPFVGKVDASLLNRVTSADAGRNAGIGLSARAGGKLKKTAQTADFLGGR